jgi:hypothetical protein
MSKKQTRKFYLQLTSGDKFEISELDFINIENRIGTGRTNGWYMERQHLAESTRHGWKIAFKDIGMVYSDGAEIKDEKIKNIDIDKRKMPEVGKVEEPKETGCTYHDWNNPETWTHVTQIVGGRNRYYKQCNECGGKSPLIKKREVEIAQEKKGETLDTVLLVE